MKGHSRIHTGIRNLLSNVVKLRVWIQVQLQLVRAHGLQRHTHRPGKAGRRIRNEAQLLSVLLPLREGTRTRKKKKAHTFLVKTESITPKKCNALMVKSLELKYLNIRIMITNFPVIIELVSRVLTIIQLAYILPEVSAV